jgi:hypothetical protein
MSSVDDARAALIAEMVEWAYNRGKLGAVGEAAGPAADRALDAFEKAVRAEAEAPLLERLDAVAAAVGPTAMAVAGRDHAAAVRNTVDGVARMALRGLAAELQDFANSQQPPECSICRRHHGREVQHECE